ncbi:hypothetical protein DFS34DRAFT_627570 [Phlyctochytrium arcticum]|nr:hypothetical protein DFS34DRAFT_627570 [Phlyctochytrium arcticum]
MQNDIFASIALEKVEQGMREGTFTEEQLASFLRTMATQSVKRSRSSKDMAQSHSVHSAADDSANGTAWGRDDKPNDSSVDSHKSPTKISTDHNSSEPYVRRPSRFHSPRSSGAEERESHFSNDDPPAHQTTHPSSVMGHSRAISGQAWDEESVNHSELVPVKQEQEEDSEDGERHVQPIYDQNQSLGGSTTKEARASEYSSKEKAEPASPMGPGRNESLSNRTLSNSDLLPPSPPPPLPVVDVALEVHLALMQKIENEYKSGKSELFGLEQQHAEIGTYTTKLSKEIEELTLTLQAKKTILEKRLMERGSLEAVIKFLRLQLMAKKADWTRDREKAKEMRNRVMEANNFPQTKHAPQQQQQSQRLETPVSRQSRNAAPASEASANDLPSSNSTINQFSKRPRPAENDQFGGTDTARVATYNQHPSSEHDVCYAFNHDECASGSTCPKRHVCIACSGPHKFYSCPTKRSICFRFNNAQCTLICNREHRCLRCGSGNHAWQFCPVAALPPNGSEHCLIWNASVNCHQGINCDRKHQCVRCGGSHAVIHCPENVVNYFNSTDGRTRTHPLHMGTGNLAPPSLTSSNLPYTPESVLAAHSGYPSFNRPVMPYYGHDPKRPRIT